MHELGHSALRYIPAPPLLPEETKSVKEKKGREKEGKRKKGKTIPLFVWFLAAGTNPRGENMLENNSIRNGKPGVV